MADHVERDGDITPAPPNFLVVGLGASAGGIEALQQFFTHVPADSSMAYVVILHLSPDYESHLASVLQVVAPIRVTQVTQRMLVEPNHVYVISPNQHLMMVDGHIAVSPTTTIEERRAPVDIFFRTLADSHNSHAVSVVLSGTGANGSMGLKRVKERGGAVFVQDPNDAAYDEMPRNAIATDLVDDVPPVRAIPGRIMAYHASLGSVTIPTEAVERPQSQQEALRDILMHLRVHTGHDFSNYKRRSILRRIERRISVHNLPDLPSYAALLRNSPDEARALLKDLLISVTNFFRDADAFAALEYDVLPRLVSGKGAEDQLRVWVVACATGEEAYSLAMLLAERTLDMPAAPKVQIFATDIDEAALARAREGRYTLNDVADVSPERLRRLVRPIVRPDDPAHGFFLVVFEPSTHVLPDAEPVAWSEELVTQQLEAEVVRLHAELRVANEQYKTHAEELKALNEEQQATVEELRSAVEELETSREEVQSINEELRTVNQELKVRVEEATHSSNNLRNLVNSTNIATIFLDRSFRVQFFTPVTTEIFNLIQMDYNRKLADITHRLIKVNVLADAQTVLDALQPVEREVRTVDHRVFLMRAQPYRTADDWIAGVVITFVNITERIRAEEALRESEERLRGLANVVPDLTWSSEADGLTTWYNERWVEYTGQTHEQMLGWGWTNALHLDDREASARRYREAIEQSKPLQQEHRIRRYDGEYRWFLVRAEPLLGEDGRVLRMYGAATDIHEIREAERSLRESEARFRTLTNDVPQVIWTNTAAGEAIYFNQRWYEYSGLSYEESFGLGWQAFVHPDDAPASLEGWQRALVAGEVFDTEFRLRRADGVYRWHLGRNVPLRDTNGQVSGWFGSATDIEELKQAEAQLRESEERFRLLVEGAHDYAMFLLDPENRITFWSTGAERVFGWTADEAIGQRASIIFTPEDRERGVVEREFQIALAQGRAENRRWHVRKDGTRLFLDGVQLRLDDELGQLRGFVKVGRDATALRQAQDALREAHDALETRVQERTAELQQLSSQRQELLKRVISAQEDERQRVARELHDTLGQFLSALNVRLSLVQSNESLPASVVKELAQLRSLAQQLDVEVDRLTMELRPPSLESLGLAEALDSYAQDWGATSGVSIDVVVTGLGTIRLPMSIESTVYRIVQEALTNVLKHAQATTVSVIVERRAVVLRVIIEDNGVGFDVNAVRRSGAGRRQVGLIGMTERATLVGGELIVESEPGLGTNHLPAYSTA